MGEWFKIVTGVRQGCVLSPLIFILVMDWILKRATDNDKGLLWNKEQRLADLDFADDIALLESSWAGISELTNRVEEEAATVGLRINADKTKIMVIGDFDVTNGVQAGGKQLSK